MHEISLATALGFMLLGAFIATAVHYCIHRSGCPVECVKNVSATEVKQLRPRLWGMMTLGVSALAGVATAIMGVLVQPGKDNTTTWVLAGLFIGLAGYVYTQIRYWVRAWRLNRFIKRNSS